MPQIAEKKHFNWRYFKEQFSGGWMAFLTLSSVLLVIAIGVGLYIKASPILHETSLKELLWSGEWKPLRNHFGFFPFIMGTVFVTLLAVAWVLPVALLTAVFLTEYAKPYVKRYVFPTLDILAGFPSVIYGVWGTLLIVPWISNKIGPLFLDEKLGEYTSGYTVLAGGIVLGVMILPLLVSLFIEIFSSIPDDFRFSSISLGATRWQTTKFVILKKALPGIIASAVLAISRALGETIAILMVCGCNPAVPKGLLDACYPIPALIANNYGEMLSLPMYEAALMFAALLLFVVVLVFNLVSRIVLYRVEKTFR